MKLSFVITATIIMLCLVVSGCKKTPAIDEQQSKTNNQITTTTEKKPGQ